MKQSHAIWISGNYQTNAVFGCNLQVGKGKRKKKENGKRKDRKGLSCMFGTKEGRRKEKKRMEYSEFFFFFFFDCK